MEAERKSSTEIPWPPKLDVHCGSYGEFAKAGKVKKVTSPETSSIETEASLAKSRRKNRLKRNRIF